MDLGFIAYARRCQAKRLHSPVEIFTPVFAAERKAFTDGGLVDLDDLDSRFFQVLDLVADGQCDLPASERSRLIIADKRPLQQDRKSTRLNSSHGYISYAVFCLKKKKSINPVFSGN